MFDVYSLIQRVYISDNIVHQIDNKCEWTAMIKESLFDPEPDDKISMQKIAE